MRSSGQIKVSVVTPAYNAQSLIGRTIQSVVDQTYTNWEMIVVDDCSSDETRRVVEEWVQKDCRIKLIALDKNFGGPAGPRNIGVGAAVGDYVAFLDADDIWHPKKLEVQLEVLANSNVDFVCSKMKDFFNETDVKFDSISDYSLEYISFGQQSVRARIPTSSVIVSRSTLMSYPFEESRSYKAVEDYHCWLRLLEGRSSCIKILAPLLFYRKIEGQISGSKLEMMKKVFMVHRDYPSRGFVPAIILTFTHVLGGFYFRFIRKGM